jgi:hypothetical protein
MFNTIYTDCFNQSCPQFVFHYSLAVCVCSARRLKIARTKTIFLLSISVGYFKGAERTVQEERVAESMYIITLQLKCEGFDTSGEKRSAYVPRAPAGRGDQSILREAKAHWAHNNIL